MEASEFNRTISRVGLLFRGRESGKRIFLGSCFCIVSPRVFVTAAHCLDETPLDELWVNHHGGPQPDMFTSATRVEMIREADIAVVCTEAPAAKWVEPFQFVRYFANLGENVCALGYPLEAISRATPNMETMRFFRGNIQRPFGHKSSLAPGPGYSAYELSFPCPYGLSGGPLFLEEDPNTVIGVITEDIEVGTLLTEEETLGSPEHTTRIETKRVINYGVAANLFAASLTLEQVLGTPLPRR